MNSIIIPIYNEKDNLDRIFQKVAALPFEKEIVMVDDFSTDGTRALLEKYKTMKNVRVVYHNRNMGKGAAIRTGIQHTSGDIVMIQDADLEYNPDELPGLASIIEQGKADVVFGSRFLGEHEKKYLNVFYWGNMFLSLLISLVYGRKVTDMETCYKVFRSKVIKSFHLNANRFDFEPEITAKVLKSGCRLVEVPISYHSRSYEEGKKIGWRDGLVAIYSILKYRFVD